MKTENDTVLDIPDTHEGESSEAFQSGSCECKLGPPLRASEKTPCINWFSSSEIRYRREQCLTMRAKNPQALEFYLMGHMSASGQRQINLGGHRVCFKTFAFLSGVSSSMILRLSRHYEENGFSLRVHKSTGQPSNNPFNAERHHRSEAVQNLLENEVFENGVAVPGRRTSYLDLEHSVSFPSEWTKVTLYRKYLNACHASGVEKIISRASFISYWKGSFPEIVGKRSDICTMCSNPPECMSHLDRVQTELKDYEDRVDLSIKSRDSFTFLSLNFNATKALPRNAAQVDKLNFLSLLKVDMFCIDNEGSGSSHVYMVDESDKGISPDGCNLLISCLFHELFHYANTPHLAIQCDRGEKVSLMMGFLSYMSIFGPWTEISIHFPIENHSQISGERNFELLSRRYSKQDSIESYEDLIKVVKGVSRGSKFRAIPTTGNGRRIVNLFDWDSFFQEILKPIADINKYHIFTFKASAPGEVWLREDSTQSCLPIRAQLFNVPIEKLPPYIPSKFKCKSGALSNDRQEYLLKHVAPLVSEKKRKKFIKYISKEPLNDFVDEPTAVHHSLLVNNLDPRMSDSLENDAQVNLNDDKHTMDFSTNEESIDITEPKVEIDTFSSVDSSPSRIKSRCMDCKGCSRYVLYLNGANSKCYWCKHCKNKYLKRLCKKFDCLKAK